MLNPLDRGIGFKRRKDTIDILGTNPRMRPFRGMPSAQLDPFLPRDMPNFPMTDVVIPGDLCRIRTHTQRRNNLRSFRLRYYRPFGIVGFDHNRGKLLV